MDCRLFFLSAFSGAVFGLKTLRSCSSILLFFTFAIVVSVPVLSVVRLWTEKMWYVKYVVVCS